TLQEVSTWLQSMSPDDYRTGQHLLERANPYARLCQEVYATVRAYGPAIRRTAFSREACYRVCAAILIHFNVTTDDPQPVQTVDADDAARLTRVAATVGRYVRARRVANPPPQTRLGCKTPQCGKMRVFLSIKSFFTISYGRLIFIASYIKTFV